MPFIRSRIGTITIAVIMGTLAAFGVSRCEGPGPHPFTQASHVTRIPPAFIVKFTVLPHRDEAMYCSPQTPDPYPIPALVCVPYQLPYVP